MEKTKRKNEQTPQRAKTITVFRKDDDGVYGMMVFILMMFGCAFFFMLPNIIELLQLAPFIAFFFLCIIIMPVYIPITHVVTDRLEVTSVGLRWWRYGFKKAVGWDGITGFGLEERIGKYGRRYQVGVIYAYGGSIPVTKYIKIPGGVFHGKQSDLKAFKHHPLGMYLYEYAPHLFESQDTSL